MKATNERRSNRVLLKKWYFCNYLNNSIISLFFQPRIQKDLYHAFSYFMSDDPLTNGHYLAMLGTLLSSVLIEGRRTADAHLIDCHSDSNSRPADNYASVFESEADCQFFWKIWIMAWCLWIGADIYNLHLLIMAGNVILDKFFKPESCMVRGHIQFFHFSIR